MRKIHEKEMEKILKLNYIKPVIKLYEKQKEKYGAVKVLDQLYDIMIKSKSEVEKLIEERKRQGIIEDKNQARKSAAGNNFQGLIIYALIDNIKEGNLQKDLIILKTKQHKILDKYATIKVADETQKPDIDILIFTEKEIHPIIVFSCKTSLRERAGQTYKWKLLVEITKKCPQLKEEYKLEYPEERKVLTGFITTNFYNEINQPQQKGMLKFFDLSYITKPIKPQEYIKPLSHIIKDLNEIFS